MLSVQMEFKHNKKCKVISFGKSLQIKTNLILIQTFFTAGWRADGFKSAWLNCNKLVCMCVVLA